MTSLRGLVEDLGASVLEVAMAPRGLDVELSGELVLHDPSEELDAARGDVVVAVGMESGAERNRLLRAMEQAGAPVLVIKEWEESRPTPAVGAEHGVAVLLVPRSSRWTQVVLLLSSALSRGALGLPGDRLAGVRAGDLFAIANVIAELLEAPITIEDTRSRVIAFSKHQEDTDGARSETILGRQVPDHYLAALRRQGVFRRLVRQRGPIYIPPLAQGVKSRVTVAVRSGDEILGSIWAIVNEPLASERERVLLDAANLVALHLLRLRVASDLVNGIEADLVSAILRGTAMAPDAARRLDLGAGPFVIVALGVGTGGESNRGALALGPCRNLLALHLTSVSSRVAAGLIGSVAYAVVPIGTGRSHLRVAAEAVVERAQQLVGGRVCVALGASVAGLREIPPARVEADEILRVLQGRSATNAAGRVGELADVRAEMVLQRFADASNHTSTLLTGPAALLARHDAEHGTALVATCRAFLDAFGDVEQSAATVGVHPNTVRYRMRLVRKVTGAALDDPEERLALNLELRLLPP